MEEDVKVVGLCGSLRENSYSRKTLGICLEGARELGGSTEKIDLSGYDLDIFNPDHPESQKVNELRETIQRSNSVILSTPMYHGSYSSPIKTALDYCGFDEFEGKTVGLTGVSGGSFPITALEHLRTVCRALNAWVIPHQAAVPNASQQFQNGDLQNSKLRERLVKLGRRSVEYSDISPDPSTFESDQNKGPR